MRGAAVWFASGRAYLGGKNDDGHREAKIKQMGADSTQLRGPLRRQRSGPPAGGTADLIDESSGARSCTADLLARLQLLQVLKTCSRIHRRAHTVYSFARRFVSVRKKQNSIWSSNR